MSKSQGGGFGWRYFKGREARSYHDSSQACFECEALGEIFTETLKSTKGESIILHFQYWQDVLVDRMFFGGYGEKDNGLWWGFATSKYEN